MDNSTHGIKFKDKLGYALGDTAGLLSFGLITPFQMMFYTDVFGIAPKKIAVLLLIARIWDAINDPMWGGFIDSRKPTKYGRFRPYILGMSLPLAIATFLMFFKIPGLTSAQYLIYAYVTYIFWGMMYTGTNIPYGSLASVITDDEIERSSLSMWRSIGAGVGGLPAQMLLPIFVYTTTTVGGEEQKVLDPGKFAVAVAILAVLTVVTFFAHFKMTKERVKVVAKKEKNHNMFVTIKDLVTNKEFVIVTLASMLLIAFQQYTQSNYNYLLKDYFNKPELFILVTVFTYLPMAIFIPFMGKLIRKFGKKEICAFGLAFAAAINFVLFALRFTPLINNPQESGLLYIFLALLFFSGAGQTFLVLEVWAIAMDVIDYHELRTGRKEEGSCYSLFSFFRKLGQTVAGSGAAFLLGVIGYDTAKIGHQSAETLSKLYDITTIVPAVCLALMALLLGVFYKFNKKNLDEMHKALHAQRAAEAAEADTEA